MKPKWKWEDTPLGKSVLIFIKGGYTMETIKLKHIAEDMYSKTMTTIIIAVLPDPTTEAQVTVFKHQHMINQRVMNND